MAKRQPPPMSNYRQAYERFGGIPPLPKGDNTIRPLIGGNTNLTIELNGDSSVVIRVYGRPLVRYEPNGNITYTPYPSELKNSILFDVASREDVMPYDRCKQTNECYFRFIPSVNLFYLFTESITVNNGAIVSGTRPFMIPRVNRKAMNAAAKAHQFPEFQTWVKTLERLGQFKGRKASSWYRQMAIADVVATLDAGPDAWPKLFEGFSLRNDSPASFLSNVRDCIRQFEGCVELQPVDTLKGWQELYNYQRKRDSMS